MEDDGDAATNLTLRGARAPPSNVSLTPFSPCFTPAPRRLTSYFSEPSRPVPAARKLAWISLQGRLVGGPEATASRTIGGGLSREEAVAWELFSPIHRVLIVAVLAVAAAETKKSRQISQLKKSVDLRDEVLQCMQQKLDDLSTQMNSTKDQFANYEGNFFVKNNQFMADEMSELRGTKLCSCRYLAPKLHPQSGIVALERKTSNGQKDIFSTENCREEMFKSPHANIVEQEERRMSDLSDLCSSVTSSIDIQLSMLAAEQDFYNLQKELEEKDAIIKELAGAAHASNVASSKRITELEDIIRRKNLVITKLKKDMLFLEQKVIQLTRLRRPSFAASYANDVQLPVMSNNILYDMSSTSPSSSDSDCPSKSREHQSQGSEAREDHGSCQEDSFPVMESQKPHSAKAPISMYGSLERLAKQRSVSPLKENRMIYKADSSSRLRPKQMVSSGLDSKKIKRRSHPESRSTACQRKWV